MEAPLQKPPSILILLTTFLVLTNVPTSFCEDDLQFLNCTQSLTCGILIDVKYPFWGVNRADYCGLPGLQLECQEDVPKLTMESITYRILNVNPSERSLTVARDDYWRTLCPASYKNTTINSILFSYAPGLLNLTLYYGCTRSSSITGILGPVQCDIDDDNSISVFVLQQDAGISPQVGGCSESVIVTVFQDSFSNTEDNLEVNASRIGDVIDAGFGLRWSVNNNECDTCVESGGACGFDPSNGQFNCFCREGPESSSCSSASPPSPSVEANPYEICHATFHCSNLEELSYPFWTSERSENCGHPDFKLQCDGEAAEITIMSQYFRVLQVNYSTHTLKVVRADYWDNPCPQYLSNTTLDHNLFNFSSNTQNLQLYYGCPSLPLSLPDELSGQFNCSINETELINYFVTEQVAREIQVSGSLGTCQDKVLVPVFESGANSLERNSSVENLKGVVNNGFGLEWDAHNALCYLCQNSGGKCGYNPSSSEFACYCRSGTFTSVCESGKKGSRVSLSIGLAIAGAAIVGMLLVFGFFHVQRKRKRLAQQSNSKDLSTPPSSKGIVTSTTNLSQSVPSYFSSKSNLGNGGSTYFGVQVFSYTELEEATDNFDTSRELGDGGFGTVYYGILKDGREVAVKRLYESNFKRVEQFMNEIEILTRLRHSNLVTLYGCTSRHSRELLLVYEYIPNGTVADHLHGKQAKSGLLTWPLRLSIATKTAEALAYLHASDIIHRDVKTNNILLDNYFHVKVADFGLSRLFPNHVTHISTAPQGTPGYVDPEYYQCYQLTDKSDVYSFGVVLIELISSLEAVDTSRHRQDINLANMAINKIQNHELHELVDPCLGFEKDYSIRQMTTSVAELAFRCLQQERDMRPSMDEVLEVLRGIENEGFVAQAAEVVDIKADDVVLLKSIPPPLSPDSVVDVKWQMDVLRRTA